MHRFILSAKKGDIVDHINGNKLDNRRENLRFVTKRENSQNVNPFKKFPYIGIHFDKAMQKYRAEIRVNGRIKKLGTFDHPFDAACAYDDAALKYYGENCLTNVKFLQNLLVKFKMRKL